MSGSSFSALVVMIVANSDFVNMVIFFQLLLKCIGFRFFKVEETEEEGEDEKEETGEEEEDEKEETGEEEEDEKEETREEEEKQDSEFQDYDVVNSDV